MLDYDDFVSKSEFKNKTWEDSWLFPLSILLNIFGFFCSPILVTHFIAYNGFTLVSILLSVIGVSTIYFILYLQRFIYAYLYTLSLIFENIDTLSNNIEDRITETGRRHRSYIQSKLIKKQNTSSGEITLS